MAKQITETYIYAP